MHLPSKLYLGPHELKLLPTCYNAEVEPGTRCCSDSLLTAYCFVGELHTDVLEASDEMGDPHHESSCGSATIFWYFSPLLHFEHKRIRVEEGVIESALTRAVEAVQHTEKSSVFTEFGAEESMECDVLRSTRSSKESYRETLSASASTLPAVYIRLGASTTFRKYEVVMVEGQRVDKAVFAEALVHGDVRSLDKIKRDTSEQVSERIPLLQPLAPQRPTLIPIKTRLNNSLLQSMPTPTLKLHASQHQLDTAAGTSAEECDTAQFAERVRVPRMPHCSDADVSVSISAAPRLHSDSEERSEVEGAVSSTLNSVANDDAFFLFAASSEGNSPQHAPPVYPTQTSDVCARSHAPCSKYPDTAAVGSSLSSAFLSSSLFSFIPSQSATDLLSNMRPIPSDAYDRLSSSTAADSLPGPFLDDAHLGIPEAVCLTPTTRSQFFTSASRRSFQAALRPFSARRPSLRALYHKSSVIRCSAQLLHAPVSQGEQV